MIAKTWYSRFTDLFILRENCLVFTIYITILGDPFNITHKTLIISKSNNFFKNIFCTYILLWFELFQIITKQRLKKKNILIIIV